MVRRARLGVRRPAPTTERVVVDRHTGLALYGIDPVAYFTDRQAGRGTADLKLPIAGAVWRFDNEGNRAAFAADPDVYMPRFGGYDPVGVFARSGDAGLSGALGGTTSGFISSTARARAAFIADPTAVIAAAEAPGPP